MHWALFITQIYIVILEICIMKEELCFCHTENVSENNAFPECLVNVFHTIMFLHFGLRFKHDSFCSLSVQSQSSAVQNPFKLCKETGSV